jgi:hypothetical protein
MTRIELVVPMASLVIATFASVVSYSLEFAENSQGQFWNAPALRPAPRDDLKINYVIATGPAAGTLGSVVLYRFPLKSYAVGVLSVVQCAGLFAPRHPRHLISGSTSKRTCFQPLLEFLIQSS